MAKAKKRPLCSTFGTIACMPLRPNPRNHPLRAIAEVPKIDRFKMEGREKRNPQVSKRKAK
jgi:hypothetical protein